MQFCPSYQLVGAFPLPLDMGYLFGGIKHSPVNGCSAVSCKFGVLSEDGRMCFYSAILVPPSLGSQILLLAEAPLNYSVPVWQCGVKLQMLLDPPYAPTCLTECKAPTINFIIALYGAACFVFSHKILLSSSDDMIQ